MKNVTAVLGAVCLWLAAIPAAEAKPATEAVGLKAAGTTKAGAPGRPMTAVELRRLYGGKTWVWPNGGGYFDLNGRFQAVAGKDYVRGTWQASDNGKMCFGGAWTSGGKRTQNRTCFTHRTAGGTIYQRKDPSGAWYAFKHSPAQSSDEYSKLVQGNRVSDQLREVQAVLSAN